MTEYIKREDVIALAWDVTYKDEWHMHRLEKVVSVSDIAGIPSADVVERKRGKRIEGNGVDYVRCSCCHKNYDWVSQAQYYNFCPNCGADMRDFNLHIS